MICTELNWNWLACSGEEDFFKRFLSNLNTCKNGFPYCGPTRPLGTMICTNLNLHYIRRPLCKFELFWLCVLREDF
jgi:hypothetical protein